MNRVATRRTAVRKFRTSRNQLAMAVLLGLNGGAFGMQAFLAGAFINAWPGIILHIAIIPPIVLALEKAGLAPSAKGFIEVDAGCQTAVAGIFAVGDLRQKYANQIVLAAADGCVAALAAAHYVEARKAQTGKK